MNESVAKSLLTLSKSVDEIITQMFIEADKIDDEALKMHFNKAVGDLLGYIARDIIFPIEKLHPDLREDN